MRRFRKWWIRAVVAFCGLLLLAVGLYAARGPLLESLLIRRLQAAAVASFGGQVTIERLSGDWLTGVELHGVTMRDGPVVRELVAGHVELDLGIWQLWRGQLHRLSRMHLRAKQAVLVVPDRPLDASAAAAMRTEWLHTLRSAVASSLHAEIVIDVEDCEVRGRESATLRGPLRFELPARAAGAALAGTLNVPSLRAQLQVEPAGAVHLRASSPQFERLAALLVDSPGDCQGAVELELDVAAETDAIRLTGTARDVVIAGRTMQQAQLAAVVADRDFTVDELVVRTEGAEASLRDYHAQLGQPWSGVGEVVVAANGLRYLCESLPLGLAELPSWPRMALALDGIDGALAFALRDQALHVKPSKLTAPLIEVSVLDGVLPLRIAQRDAARLGVEVSLLAGAEVQRALPTSLAELSVVPTAGVVSAQCDWRDGGFQLQADVQLALRDLDGLAGTVTGHIGLPAGPAWLWQPDLKIAGPLLRGLPAVQVIGEVELDPLAANTTAKLESLQFLIAEGGTIELRGDVRLDGNWPRAMADSAVTVQLRELLVSRWLQPFAPVEATTSAWHRQMLAATVSGLLRLGRAGGAELTCSWPDLPLLGSVDARLVIAAVDDGLVLQQGDLRTGLGSVQLTASLPKLSWSQLLVDPVSISSAEVVASAQYRSGPMQTFLGFDPALGLKGSVAIDAQLSGNLAAPVVALQILPNDAELRLLSLPWSRLAGELRCQGGAVSFHDVSVSVARTEVLLRGSVTLVDGAWRGELDGKLTQLPDDHPDSELHAQFALDSQQLTFSQLQVRNRLLQLDASKLAIACGQAAWAEAAIQHDLSNVMAAAVGGTLQVTVPDLSLLPNMQERGVAGRAVLEVALAGTLSEPTPSASLQVAGGSVRIPEGPRIDDVSARLDATSQRITCTQLSGSVAGGALRVQGTFDCSQPFWQAWQAGVLDLTIAGEDVLLRRRNGIKIRSDLNLTAKGPLSQIDLKGTLTTQASKVVQRLPYFSLGGIGGAGTARGLGLVGLNLGEHVHVNLDLAVTSAQPIVIATNVIAGDVTSALTIQGTLRAPRIDGTLAMPSGTVTFPGCTFRTSNALLRFDRDDSAFPTVSMTATGRRHGYDLRMVVRGPYHEPEIQLSSSPPLPAEQLAVLVTTGARPDTLRGSRAVGTLLGSYLVQELADYLFGSESTEAKEGFVSRFEVETGTEISTNGTESIVINFRVVDKVFLQGERDVYEDVNLGIVYRIRFK